MVMRRRVMSGRTSARWLVTGALAGLLLGAGGCGTLAPAPRLGSVATEVPVVRVAPAAPPARRNRWLWYAPNRALDFLDIFRLRLRFGPGLAAHARGTQFASVFVGRYNSVYVGLPGPRGRCAPRSGWGYEEERGLLLMNVDATDDLPHEPHYTWSECVAGGQLVLVGLEIGLDPVEIADFFAGWFRFDPRRDDR